MCAAVVCRPRKTHQSHHLTRWNGEVQAIQRRGVLFRITVHHILEDQRPLTCGGFGSCIAQIRFPDHDTSNSSFNRSNDATPFDTRKYPSAKDRAGGMICENTTK